MTDSDIEARDFLVKPGFNSIVGFMELFMQGRWEKTIGQMIGFGGLFWGLYHIVYEVHALGQELDPGFLRYGPMPTMLLGLILWLHGKYRQPNTRHI